MGVDKHIRYRGLLAASFPYKFVQTVFGYKQVLISTNGKRWAEKIGKIKASVQLKNEKLPI